MVEATGEKRLIGVTFIDQVAQTLKQIDIKVATGGQGHDQRLTIACHDHAADHGYTHWVQPYTYEQAPLLPNTEWLVFKCVDSRRRDFVTRQPTREAAEMWVVHRGA